MESWEYTYQFVVRDGKIHVAPISLRCMGCDYVAWIGKDILQHQLEKGHFYKMQPEIAMMEEWKSNKHPMIPLIMQMHLPPAMQGFVKKDE